MTFIGGLIAWALIGFCAVFIVSTVVEIVKKVIAYRRAKAMLAKIQKEGEKTE